MSELVNSNKAEGVVVVRLLRHFAAFPLRWRDHASSDRIQANPSKSNQIKSPGVGGRGVASGQWTVVGGEKGRRNTARSNPVKPGQTRSNLVKPGQTWSNPVKPGQTQSNQSNPVKPYEIKGSQALAPPETAKPGQTESNQSNRVKPSQTGLTEKLANDSGSEPTV
jgi:hypothetical protein